MKNSTSTARRSSSFSLLQILVLVVVILATISPTTITISCCCCHGLLLDGQEELKEQECQTVGEEGSCLEGMTEPEPLFHDDDNNDDSTLEDDDMDHHHDDDDDDNNNNHHLAPAGAPCVNFHDECNFWANELEPSECDENPSFMFKECQEACGMCDKTSDELEELIENRLEDMEAEQHQRELREQHFGLEQVVQTEQGELHLLNMIHYMKTIVMVEDKYQHVRELCFNEHEQCVEWAAEGECDANPSFMTRDCAAACYQCHAKIYDERCPFDPTNTTADAWKEGQNDLNKMFQRIVAEYDPTKDETSDEDVDEKKDHRPVVSVLSQPPDGPWVVLIDNFLTQRESDRLIELGQTLGYEISKDVGEEQPDGTFSEIQSPDRTSTNAWCLNECYDDPITKSVLAKIENITGIPDTYSEYLQLLNYQVGQFYGQHHDYIEYIRDRQEGARIATVFLYLNDVEAGGGTNFPLLKNNITVMPKRGSCLIWPSVLNEFPNDKDDRTAHQALPVEKGVKYGANAWLHNRDFKTSHKEGCA